MREMDIRSCRKRRYRATTNSQHDYAVAPNLARDIRPTAPNQLWNSDITYIPTDQGWLYLAMVKDRFTREIVGFSTGPQITSELVQIALNRAILKHRPQKGLMFHSDRGVQYCCHAFQKMLKKHQITPSMSRKGNPYDNAVSENFFSCIKCEMIHLQRFASRRDAELAVFRYIEGFYNRRRRHSALGRIAPREFRRRWEKAQQGHGGGIPCAHVR
jgi:transposase InsO family protein